MSKPNLQDLIEKAQEHTSPCGSRECIDLECQVEVMGLDRVYTLVEQGSWDQPKAVEFWKHFRQGLHRFLNDSQYGKEVPDFFFEASWEFAESVLRDQGVTSHPVHVQVEKPVLEAPAKTVRKPRTAKHQPRTTDGVVHPVVVTTVQKEQSMTTSDITINESVLADTIERLAQQRVAEILAAKAVQPPPAEVPVTVIGHNTVMTLGRDSAQERESAGLVLPEFVVDKALTVPALVLTDVALDLVASAALRSPYNKARFRLEKNQEVLSKEVTYRALAIEHSRLAALAAARPAKAVAVEVPTQAAAKVSNPDVQRLIDTLGWTQEKAEAVVAAMQ